tara:strand:- start:41 stop:1006 length:966 start_codon:yes stop_codon:yes gene_type:complete
MTTYNEWGKLKKVIVGVADNAVIPSLDLGYRTVLAADKLNEKDIVHSINYPQIVIDEANEDLDTLVNFLQKESVEVLRPNRSITSFFNYCPRDSVVTYGNDSYAAPMSIKIRTDEYRAFEHHLSNLHILDRYHEDDLYNISCVGNKNILALTDAAPAFDAANIIKANDDILYLVSNTGNELGATYLQEVLGTSATVRVLRNAYSYSHIDTTVAFIREGLLVVNPSRITNKDMLPYPFNTWDIIWCPEPTEIEYYKPFNNASPWVNMNMLSINSNLVILEERQHSLRKELEKYNIEVAMLPMRHARTLAGAFHCVTLDLDRD